MYREPPSDPLYNGQGMSRREERDGTRGRDDAKVTKQMTTRGPKRKRREGQQPKRARQKRPKKKKEKRDPGQENRENPRPEPSEHPAITRGSNPTQGADAPVGNTPTCTREGRTQKLMGNQADACGLPQDQPTKGNQEPNHLGVPRMGRGNLARSSQGVPKHQQHMGNLASNSQGLPMLDQPPEVGTSREEAKPGQQPRHCTRLPAKAANPDEVAEARSRLAKEIRGAAATQPVKIRGLVCPRWRARMHPAAPLLLQYASNGCPVSVGRDRTAD